ncbi:MAG: hypothetical protein ACKV1O_28945 [Saprospiraceae bacterium]
MFIIFASCRTPSVQHSLHGLYFAKGNDFEYSLTLNRDSTFILKLKYQDAVPECSGKWRYLDKDTLDLSCSALNDIAQSLTNGYMSERNRKVKIINQNKLKLGEVVLKKVKQP